VAGKQGQRHSVILSKSHAPKWDWGSSGNGAGGLDSALCHSNCMLGTENREGPGLMHARQALHGLSHLPSPKIDTIHITIDGGGSGGCGWVLVSGGRWSFLFGCLVGLVGFFDFLRQGFSVLLSWNSLCKPGWP